MRSVLRVFGLVAVLAAVGSWVAAPLRAQGVTTAAMRGRVLDDAGNPVVGATVLLTNTSTGQRFQAASRAGGLYNLENVAIGGPYTIEARAIGYQPAQRTGIVLTLGQVLDLNLRMQRAAVELAAIAITVAEADPIFAPNRNGTELTVGDTAITRLPTLDREFSDFVRLSPQVAERDGGGIAVAGQNNRFNTIQIDGSTVNDRFGLGRTGLTGGQASGRAVGLEAVKEYQILLAPYDVRQGNFTGALINAVTKSGTNEFHGSAFYYFRNQDLAGYPLSQQTFTSHQFGASLGGPVVRDRVHFFVNAEFRRRQTPAGGPYLGGPSGVFATAADVDAFNAAMSGYGLAEGSGGAITNQNPLNNLLARVDWQLGAKSRLTLRYIQNTADDDIFSRSTSGLFQLDLNGYRFQNRTYNPSLQFFTNFANGISNEFIFSYNRVRDDRTPNMLAPQITVNGFNAADGSGTYGIRSGSEEFSQGNELNQDIWELTDNVTLATGAHRITLGTRNELYKVLNLFAQSSYGVWEFEDLPDFESATSGPGIASRYQIAGDLGGGIPATFSSAILGLYAQDQWQVTPRFALTYGLRVDMPVFFDDPTYDPRVIEDFGPQNVPSGKILLAPRIGFNYDLSGRGTTQIRGGAGMFSGTPAYVWYSNAYSNNGTKLARLTCTGGNTPTFASDYLNQPTSCDDGTTIEPGGTTIGEVDLIAADTKFPQVLRANLALDHRFPGDVVATFEAIYTRGINDYFIVNRNLLDPVGEDAHGRVMYGDVGPTGVGTNINYYDLTLYGPSSNGGVFELRNTGNNYSWNATVQLIKQFTSNWSGTAGYTYAQAKDVQSFTSSRAISNWRFGRVYAIDQMDDKAETSSFDRPHRIVVAATYTAPWKRFPTDLTLSYVGQSGQPYTLIAGGSSGRGDLNADGTNGNDPIYIPTDAATELNFVTITNADGSTIDPATQAAAFDQYIADEPCLASQRGRIMQRNSCRNPWQSFINLIVRQSLPRFGDNTLMLELGVYNLPRALGIDAGRIKTAGGGEFYTQDVLTVRSATSGEPNYNFNPNLVTERFKVTSSPLNSWQLQMALRYTF